MDFSRVTINLPLTLHHQLSSNEVLILPSPFYKLTAHVSFPGHRTRTLGVAVAGNMRLRSIMAQILGDNTQGVDVWVEGRNGWVRPGLDTRIDDVMRSCHGHGYGRCGNGGVDRNERGGGTVALEMVVNVVRSSRRR